MSPLSKLRRLRELIELHRILPALLVALVVGLSGCTVKYRHEVEKPGTPPEYTYSAGGFIRYDGYGEVAGDLEIASVDFRRPGSNTIIRLVGVVHIGDLEYYRTLQRECLDTADIVLFEGVKMEGAEPEPGKEDDLSALYTMMSQLLGLGFQKDGIDYARENFVHCDITVGPDDPLANQVDTGQLSQATQLMGPMVTFKQMLASGPDGKRVEDALKHQMVSVMTMQMGGVDDAELLEKIRAKSQKDTPAHLRERAEKAAEALKDLPILPGMGMPPEMQEQILDRRNDYVIEKLKERIDALDPSEPHTIAVFYGAAHHPGIAKAMQGWGFEPAETTWLRAWSMNSRGQGHVSERSTDEPVPAKPREQEPVLF